MKPKTKDETLNSISNKMYGVIFNQLPEPMQRAKVLDYAFDEQLRTLNKVYKAIENLNTIEL